MCVSSGHGLEKTHARASNEPRLEISTTKFSKVGILWDPSTYSHI